MPVLISLVNAPAAPVIDIRLLRSTAEKVLSLVGRPESELSILLVSDHEIAGLNRRFRNKKGPTNVLAFSQVEGQAIPRLPVTLLGDVVVSIDTAAREAAQENISVHSRITALLVHGILHLLGFDHERSAPDAREMAGRELDIMQELRNERRKRMTKLAINVDHVATIREARGGTEPDPVLAAGICELAGAEGIVVHLREDRRHIQDRDVTLLRQTVKTKLNLEMAAAKEIVDIALDLKPDMVTLVPEKRRELTTEGGLNVAGQKKKIKDVIAIMDKAGIPVSLFIDPAADQIKASRDAGATFVEIHTGRYAEATSRQERDKEFSLIADAAEMAFEAGLLVNAGHGLNYVNTARVAALETVEELSIGHAVMARAIFVGLDQAVREMLSLIPVD